MTGTTHALVGAAVGAFARRPGRALAAGVVSHGLLDCVPHRDYERSAGMLPDVAGLLCVLGLAARMGTPAIVAGAIGGLLPDVENLIPSRSGCRPKVFPSHWFRHQDRVTKGAAAVEVAVALGALCVLAAHLAGSLEGEVKREMRRIDQVANADSADAATNGERRTGR